MLIVSVLVTVGEPVHDCGFVKNPSKTMMSFEFPPVPRWTDTWLVPAEILTLSVPVESVQLTAAEAVSAGSAGSRSRPATTAIRDETLRVEANLALPVDAILALLPHYGVTACCAMASSGVRLRA